MFVERSTAAFASLAMLVVLGLSCAPQHSAFRHLREQTATQSSTRLAKLLNRVEPWPNQNVPWPHAIEYSHASWAALVSAAKVMQESNPQFMERTLRGYQRVHDRSSDDSKLLLVLRVAFDLPETRPLEKRVGFGGWRDLTDSDNMKTNAAWPISWNSGHPKLIVGFTLFEGERYDAATEFTYFANKYPARDLTSFAK